MTVAFTGHRHLKHPTFWVYLKLLRTIKRLIEQGADTFLCGGALGFDTLAARGVLYYRKRYPVQLRLIVPCKNQERYFTPEQRAEYARILAAADEVKILSENYYRGCMHARNRYMVEECTVLVAYCHDSTGGTAYTTDFALKNQKPVIRL